MLCLWVSSSYTIFLVFYLDCILEPALSVWSALPSAVQQGSFSGNGLQRKEDKLRASVLLWVSDDMTYLVFEMRQTGLVF